MVATFTKDNLRNDEEYITLYGIKICDERVFVESKVKRDKEGKFASGNSGSKKSEESEEKPIAIKELKLPRNIKRDKSYIRIDKAYRKKAEPIIKDAVKKYRINENINLMRYDARGTNDNAVTEFFEDKTKLNLKINYNVDMKELRDNAKNNYLMRDPNLSDEELKLTTVHHEMGHIIAYSLFMRYKNNINNTKIQDDEEYERVLKEEIEKTYNEKYKDDKTILSEYAKNDNGEFIAECYANGMSAFSNGYGKACIEVFEKVLKNKGRL